MIDYDDDDKPYYDFMVVETPRSIFVDTNDYYEETGYRRSFICSRCHITLNESVPEDESEKVTWDCQYCKKKFLAEDLPMEYYSETYAIDPRGEKKLTKSFSGPVRENELAGEDNHD